MSFAALLLLSTSPLLYGRMGFGHLDVEPVTWAWFALQSFGCFWLVSFLRHVQHCTVAGSVSFWYFEAQQREPCTDCGSAPVLRATYRTLRYHGGSVALGSLLIATLFFIKILVLTLMKRLASLAGDSKIAKLACLCVACCMRCVEKCIQFLARTGYVQMMVKGDAFCVSAMEALALITRNFVKVAVVRAVGSGFLLLGKLFISASAAGTCAFVLLTTPPYSTELFSVAAPTAATAIGAWVVAMGLMGVYNMTVDTTTLCFCIDAERAKNGQPTSASPELATLIQDNPGKPPKGKLLSAEGGERPATVPGRAARGSLLPTEVRTSNPEVVEGVLVSDGGIELESGRSGSRV